MPTDRVIVQQDPTDVLPIAWIVAAAFESQIFTSVLEGPASPTVHAARLNLDVAATAGILRVLTHLGLVDRVGDCYRASTCLKEIEQLAPGGLRGMAGLWKKELPSFLATGRLAGGATLDSASRETSYQGIASDLWRLFAGPAQRLADHLGTRPWRVLDVGAGSGVWSLTVARRYAESSVTAVDFPRVLDSFMAHAAAVGMTGRIDVLPGDYHECELPTRTFDLVILANVLHLESSEAARALLSRSSRALAPGGRLVVVDVLPGEGPESQLAGDVYSLSLAMRTGARGPHQRSVIEAWMEECGLSGVQFVQLGTRRPLLGCLIGASESS